MSRSRLAIVAFGGSLACAIAVAYANYYPIPAPKDKPAGKKSEDGLGYTAAFDAELKQIGQITPQQFADRYTSRDKYLTKLSWDPTTAKFYDRFSADPRKTKPYLPPGVLNDDFRLNDAELAAFKKNGFVVSERLSTASFAEMYYRIFSRDLPVYVSADAVLHAWHRTYDAMLMELELTALAPALSTVLDGMANSITAADKAYGTGVLADSVTDADYFLAVARSLLEGKPVKSQLGQDERVAATLKACDSLALQEFNLFGRLRKTDFSQFKPRGHYERSVELQHYFRAMMWCGRIDLRVAGHPDEASPREMGAAVVLYDLLKRSDGFKTWEQFDKVLQTFVGRTDSMTFAQLGDVLAEARIKSPTDVKNLAALSALQQKILDGTIGLQHIRGHVYVSPLGSEKVRLPRSFTVLGQKFVLDSWALSKVVYDDIIWSIEKVERRVPSGLDAAFSVLNNEHAVPQLVARMNRANGHKWRDGKPYQHNLAAVHNVIESQKPAAWDENLYMNWLATLRELSKPTTAAKYPEAMRSEAWAMKSLNTQLASWTQLRHDTVLYVKQSYTAVPSCDYPAGYVEPVPHFWARMEKMVTRSAELIEKATYPDRSFVPTENRFGPKGFEKKGVRVTYFGKTTQDQQAKFLRNFARQVTILKGIAEKQLAATPLTMAEAKFLKEVVQTMREGSGSTRYGGWYPGLFYQGRYDSGVWDATVADVHTDPPAPVIRDPGCVLHEGVGNVDYLLIAVDSGKDHMVYAGPVLSHYEFEVGGTARRSDSEWRKDIKAGKLPPRPEWTRSYLVPGENKEAKSYYHADDK